MSWKNAEAEMQKLWAIVPGQGFINAFHGVIGNAGSSSGLNSTRETNSFIT